jgi:hypothetical protein
LAETRSARPPDGRPLDDPYPRATPLLLLVASAALFSLTALGRIDSFDGEMMFRVTESLVERGSLVVRDDVFHTNEPYAVYGLGTSIAAIPIYLLARATGVDPRWAMSLFNPLIAAAAVALFYALGRRLGYGRGLALLLSAGFAFGSLLWPYTKTFFSEPLMIALLLAASLAAFEVRRGSLPAAAALGAALGFAVLTREDTAAVLPFFALYVLWPRGRAPLSAPALVAAALPLALLLGITVWYHELRFQSLFAGYAEKTGNVFAWTASNLFTGLYGQVVSPGKGLLFYTPLVALAPLAWSTFWRRAPLECALFTALIVERFVLFSFLNRWYGGVCWGPRYVVPTIPFLLLPIGLLLLDPAGAALARRVVFLAVGLVSVVAQLPGVAIFYTDYLYALDEHKITWEQIFFEPRFSPLFGQLGWVVSGRNAAWLLPIARPELALPVHLGLALTAAAAALALVWPHLPRRPLVAPARAVA